MIKKQLNHVTILFDFQKKEKIEWDYRKVIMG